MKKIIVSLFLAATVSACHHVYYAPNTANVPLLSEKGETRINALYVGARDSEFEGGELQLSHAVSKNVGVMLNGFAAGKTDEVSDFNRTSHTENGNGAYIEAAVGYFKALDEKKKWITEAYGGIGFGSAKNDYGFGDHSKVSSTKFFLQPAIGYKSNYFEFAIAPKLSYVAWSVKEDHILSKENLNLNSDMKAIRSNAGFFAFEPTFLIRGGGKGFKVQFGYTFSHSKSADYLSEGLKESATAHLGVSINLKSPKNRTALCIDKEVPGY